MIDYYSEIPLNSFKFHDTIYEEWHKERKIIPPQIAHQNLIKITEAI
jgi:hypothetical protein